MALYELLQHSLPIELGVCPDGIKVDALQKTNPFTLSDSKACHDCHLQPQRADRAKCNEEVLSVNNNGKEFVVINFEEYACQFDYSPARFSERCDYLLLDGTESHHKIAFCDLTCSDQKWVEPNKGLYPQGKRAKARSQMIKSIEVLMHQNILEQYILTFAEKVCLFGWRDYCAPAMPISPERGSVRTNLQAFMTTPSSMARQTKSEQDILQHHFQFIQVKYPQTYEW